MSDEKILKQLNNDSNVIGYQPNLEYNKERTAVGTAIVSDTEVSYDPDKDTTLYTKTLNSFAKNTPSSVLSDINYVLKNIKRLKNNLAEKFNEERALIDNPFYNKSNNNNFSTDNIINENLRPNIDTNNPFDNINQLIDAGNTGNTSFTSQFEDIYNNVTGSIIPALINQLTNIETILSNLNDSYKDLFYNDINISIPDAKNIDASYISNMRIKEREGTHGSINYLTISFDALLNKMVSYTVFQNNKSAIKVAKVIDSHEVTQATTNDMNIITQMFNDIEDKLHIRSRGYMRNEDIELIQKSMYNYYEKRKQLNDVYELFHKNPESKFLGRKVTECSKNLEDAVKNVARVLMYNQNYLKHITELEKQKYDLQRISRSTSSNS